MHIRSLKVLALVALPLLLSSCQSLEQRGLAARESGDYRNAAEFYFGALRKGSTVENNSGYTASIGQYLEQLRSEREAISGSAGLDSYEGHTAPQLEDWMSRLSAMDVELDRIAAQVATARDLPAKKASPETLAAVSDGYGKLLASITALRDQARADGERLGVTIRSLKDFIETETAGAVRLSDSEDYEGMISLLERISVYRLGIERIEQMLNAAGRAREAKPCLDSGDPARALGLYREADGDFHLPVFDAVIPRITGRLAKQFYDEGDSLVAASGKSDIGKLLAARTSFRTCLSYDPSYRDAAVRIGETEALVAEAHIASARNFEAVGKWGNAALERNAALPFAQGSEKVRDISDMIGRDIEKLKKERVLRLILTPSTAGGLEAETIRFCADLSRSLGQDGIVTGGKWQLLKGEAAEETAGKLSRAGWDIAALTPAERKRFDVIIPVTVTAFETDGPNRYENEQSREVILKYHKEANPAYSKWETDLAAAKAALSEAQKRLAVETDAYNRRMLGRTIDDRSRDIDDLTRSEPPVQTDVPDYVEASWVEINWDESVLIDGSAYLKGIRSDGSLFDDTVSLFRRETASCVEIRKKRYADLASISERQKDLPALPDLKQKTYTSNVQETQKKIADLLLEKGELIVMDRIEALKDIDPENAVENLVYLDTLYSDRIPLGTLSELLSELKPGYTFP